jgi:hypothetical protein
MNRDHPDHHGMNRDHPADLELLALRQPELEQLLELLAVLLDSVVCYLFRP